MDGIGMEKIKGGVDFGGDERRKRGRGKVGGTGRAEGIQSHSLERCTVPYSFFVNVAHHKCCACACVCVSPLPRRSVFYEIRVLGTVQRVHKRDMMFKLYYQKKKKAFYMII